MYGTTYAIGDDPGGGGVEFPIEMQECQAVDERPHRGRHRVGISIGKTSRDDSADIGRDGRDRGDSFGVVLVAWL